MKKSCLFCGSDIVKARTIAENRLARAFPTNIPIVPGHTLICPKRHVETIDDLTPAEVKAIFALQKKLKKALGKSFKAEGFNFAWNEGELAGQNMPHFHPEPLSEIPQSRVSSSFPDPARRNEKSVPSVRRRSCNTAGREKSRNLSGIGPISAIPLSLRARNTPEGIPSP